MNDAEMLEHMGVDAAKWAEEFMKKFKDNHPDVPLDEGWMISWFANALEAGKTDGVKRGYSSGYNKGYHEGAAETEDYYFGEEF